MKKVLICLIFLAVMPSMAFSDDYVIGDGDTLAVSVWGERELSDVAIVRPDGKITLPAAGDIVASGLTPEELGDVITKRLRNFVKKPVVSVAVKQVTNNKIYVFGGGVASSVHTLPGRTTLLQFLCRLGDLSHADLERAYIVRKEENLKVDFQALFVRGDLSADIMLSAGDIIYIPDNELKKIYVIGAVNAPKYIFYREGMKVLDGILEAGGFNQFAKKNDVLILRKGQEEMSRVKVKDLVKEGDLSQNVELMPGDYVIVKESIF
jgi:polysaccharide export outer membrane protein